MRKRWIVAGRGVLLFDIIARGGGRFTGRDAFRAASTAHTTSARRNSLPPKPPPIYGESRRTFSAGMPSVLARSPLPQAIIWLDVHTVSLSPDQLAMVAWGSIIAWVWS